MMTIKRKKRVSKYFPVFDSSVAKRSSEQEARERFADAGFIEVFDVIVSVSRLFDMFVESQPSRVVVWKIVDGKKKRQLSFEPNKKDGHVRWYDLPCVETSKTSKHWYKDTPPQQIVEDLLKSIHS